MQKNYILFAVFSLLHSSVCLFFFLTLCRYVFLASSLSPRPDLCCCSFISCIMLSTEELCSEWNSYFIFFSLLLLVCLCSRYCNTVKKRNSHLSEPCCMSDRCCSFFFDDALNFAPFLARPLDHGMTTKTMMMMTAVLWCKERKRNQTKGPA